MPIMPKCEVPSSCPFCPGLTETCLVVFSDIIDCGSGCQTSATLSGKRALAAGATWDESANVSVCCALCYTSVGQTGFCIYKGKLPNPITVTYTIATSCGAADVTVVIDSVYVMVTGYDEGSGSYATYVWTQGTEVEHGSPSTPFNAITFFGEADACGDVTVTSTVPGCGVDDGDLFFNSLPPTCVTTQNPELMSFGYSGSATVTFEACD